MAAKNIYKPKNSPFWYYEFEYCGKKYRGSTRTKNEREAIAVAKAERKRTERDAEVVSVVTAEVPSLAFGDAVARYYEERGKTLSGAADRLTDLLRLSIGLGLLMNHKATDEEAERIGASTLLTQITDTDIKRLVEWRSKHRVKEGVKYAPKNAPLISSATVNRSTIIPLQALFRHAREEWKATFPHEPKWTEHKLEEQHEEARVLTNAEETKFFETAWARSTDYGAFFEFLYQSAKRLDYGLTLEWVQVKWGEGKIRKPGKRRPRGRRRIKIESVELTPGILKVLESRKGHDETHVFTYVADRTVKGRLRGQTYNAQRKSKTRAKGAEFIEVRGQKALVKGRRYCMTEAGVQSEFERICAAAGIENFGIHGLRRTRATRVYNVTHDIVLVQKMLDHDSVETTRRYLGVGSENVRWGMLDADRMRNVPIPGPHSRKKKAI